MEEIFAIIVGLVIIVLGILNIKGNISLLHSYHRKRVKEEDKLPFGKLVGLGTIIIGCAIIFMGGFSFLATAIQQGVFEIIGTIILIVGLVLGFAIILYALFKYNKGIF